MTDFKDTLLNTKDKKFIVGHLLGYLNEAQVKEGKGESLMHKLGYLSEDQFVDLAKQIKDKKFLFEALVDITKQFDARYETNFLEAINEATK